MRPLLDEFLPLIGRIKQDPLLRGNSRPMRHTVRGHRPAGRGWHADLDKPFTHVRVQTSPGAVPQHARLIGDTFTVVTPVCRTRAVSRPGTVPPPRGLPRQSETFFCLAIALRCSYHIWRETQGRPDLCSCSVLWPFFTLHLNPSEKFTGFHHIGEPGARHRTACPNSRFLAQDEAILRCGCHTSALAHSPKAHEHNMDSITSLPFLVGFPTHAKSR